MIGVVFKVVKAIVGFVLGFILSIVLIVFLATATYKLIKKPKYDFHDTMTYTIKSYNFCEKQEEGTELMCPICDRIYIKEPWVVCCSEECDDIYDILYHAVQRGDRKTIEKYGKVYK